jgi:pyridoxamine-phosphate oxidase
MTPSQNLAELRSEYHREALTEADVDPDPLRQLDRWLQEAIRAALPEPTAMTLATVGADDRPAARIVLLKGVGPDGLVFFTNYESRKGRELAIHPDAALLFHWVDIERQVRIEGMARWRARSPMPISPPVQDRRASAHGRRRKAGRFPTVTGWSAN